MHRNNIVLENAAVADSWRQEFIFIFSRLAFLGSFLFITCIAFFFGFFFLYYFDNFSVEICRHWRHWDTEIPRYWENAEMRTKKRPTRPARKAMERLACRAVEIQLNPLYHNQSQRDRTGRATRASSTTSSTTPKNSTTLSFVFQEIQLSSLCKIAK